MKPNLGKEKEKSYGIWIGNATFHEVQHPTSDLHFYFNLFTGKTFILCKGKNLVMRWGITDEECTASPKWFPACTASHVKNVCLMSDVVYDFYDPQINF